MILHFSKYSGCGNDFILVDNRNNNLADILNPKQISQMCQRRTSIGADGLIFLEQSNSANFRMRIFNSDGSEAEMCGNGVRCLARFVKDLGLAQDCFTLQSMHQMMNISFVKELISVSVPPAKEMQLHLTLNIDHRNWILHHIDTGVPHVVHFVDDIENDAYLIIAPKIRFHSLFPKGTNVNFAKINPNGSIQIRTYERGVEQETLACGTGSIATALIAKELYHLEGPIILNTRSGDSLRIDFDEGITMTGPAVKVFEGSCQL